MQDYPCEQMTAIGSLDPDATELFAGSPQALEEQPGTCCVGYARRCDNHGHQQTQRVHQDMAFATCDVFARVIATDTRSLGRFHALAVQGTCGRMLVTTDSPTNLGTQRLVNPLPRPIIAERAKVRLHTLPGRIFFGHHSPLTTGDGQIQDRIHHCSHLQGPGAASRFGRRDQIFTTMPLGVCQISGIDLVRFHIPSVSHLTGCLLFKPALREQLYFACNTRSRFPEAVLGTT